MRQMILACVLTGIAGTQANAADHSITAKKLLLKSGKMVLLSKDGLVVPGATGSSSDPRCAPDGSNSGASIILNDGTNGASLNMPCFYWSANGAGTLYKYKDATGTPKVGKLKAGQLKVVSPGTNGFPIPNGPAMVNVGVTIGADTYCMSFSGTGDGSKFLVKDTAPGICLCGNGQLDAPEVCDGPDLEGETCVSQGFDSGTLSCAPNCLTFDYSQCAICGDGQLGGTEECDPNGADAACPGSCGPDCTCKPPCEETTGGFCWFRGASAESCDTVCSNNGRFYDSATSSFAGSTGTPANCAALSSDFGLANSVAFNGACTTGLGCYDVNGPAFLRCTSPPTTSSAAGPAFRRICACQFTPEPPCQATTGGFCWFYGHSDTDCGTECGYAGRTYDPATQTYAGSSGTLANCDAVLTALGAPGSSTTDFGGSEGLGCYYTTVGNERVRVFNVATTAADHASGIRRACACQ